MYWEVLALTLPFGTSRKIKCCGDKPSAYVSNSAAGVRLGPCFRCGHREFKPHQGVTMAQLAAWRAEDKATGTTMPDLSPPDLWPQASLVWLGKAGVSVHMAVEHGAGWSEKTQRFVLPCQIHGVPTGAFTGRSLDPARPKYVQGGQLGSLGVWIGGPETSDVVFVEDVLSAWRVADAGYTACAVLGTSFRPRVLEAALVGKSTAAVWMDPDKAGDAAAVKLRHALRLYDVCVRKIKSKLDPKYHSRYQIQRYMEK